jgi:signal transduction histidine kinase
MSTRNGSKTAFAPRRPAWWIGVLMSTVVALLFYGATSKSIEHDARQRFANLARSAQHNMTSQLKSYADLLRNTASLFQISEHISRVQFHDYVQSLALTQNFPAVESVNFMRQFSDAERPAYQAQARRDDRGGDDGYPPLQIQPPQRRAHYSLITYIEPASSAPQRYGYDIGLAPRSAQLLAASRDSGNGIYSGRPLVAPPRAHTQSIPMRLPVYRAGMALTGVAQRRAAYLGSVGIAFDLKAVVRNALDDMQLRGVRVELFDGGPLAPPGPAVGPAETALYGSQDPPPAVRWWLASDRERDAMFTTTLPVSYDQRLWKARFSVRRGALYTRSDAYFPWLALSAGFVSTMLLYALFHTLASSRLRAIQMAKNMTQELRGSQVKLQLSHQRLRRLAAHAEHIKEEERKRIAREIHDDLGQNLLVLRIDADMLASRTALRHPRLHARARATLSQIDTTIKSVRQIINDLRPTVLDLGLNAAVGWQIAEFRRRTGIVCEFRDEHSETSVNDHCATAFFRILQESLSNISQHAGASLVQVELRQDHSTLSMTVRDNGVGAADTGNKAGSFGLVGIEERIRLLGGHLAIFNTAGGGMTLQVSAPIEAQRAGPSYLYQPSGLDLHASQL